MKQQINFRASSFTASQLVELIQKTGMTQTEVITVAIDRMFRKEIEMTPRQKYEAERERLLEELHDEGATESGKRWPKVREMTDQGTQQDRQNEQIEEMQENLHDLRSYKKS